MVVELRSKNRVVADVAMVVTAVVAVVKLSAIRRGMVWVSELIMMTADCGSMHVVWFCRISNFEF